MEFFFIFELKQFCIEIFFVFCYNNLHSIKNIFLKKFEIEYSISISLIISDLIKFLK